MSLSTLVNVSILVKDLISAVQGIFSTVMGAVWSVCTYTVWILRKGLSLIWNTPSYARTAVSGLKSAGTVVYNLCRNIIRVSSKILLFFVNPTVIHKGINVKLTYITGRLPLLLTVFSLLFFIVTHAIRINPVNLLDNSNPDTADSTTIFVVTIKFMLFMAIYVLITRYSVFKLLAKTFGNNYRELLLTKDFTNTRSLFNICYNVLLIHLLIISLLIVVLSLLPHASRDFKLLTYLVIVTLTCYGMYYNLERTILDLKYLVFYAKDSIKKKLVLVP